MNILQWTNPSEHYARRGCILVYRLQIEYIFIKELARFLARKDIHKFILIGIFILYFTIPKKKSITYTDLSTSLA